MITEQDKWQILYYGHGVFSAYWSCWPSMYYATFIFAELNYQQFSWLDRVVSVDTEFLCR